VPLVPDGHTIRQDSIGPNRTSNTAIIIPVNNPLERIMREIRRRTRVVGAFPDGNSALNLAAARLRHIAGTRWSTKRYLNMNLREQRNMTGLQHFARPAGRVD
jgi:transposase-like protein